MHYFTRNALEAAMRSVARSDKDPAYTIPASPELLYFPFPESATTPAYPALGVFWKLTNGKKQHVVGFCRRLDMSESDAAYFPICGVSAMSGKWSASEQTQRIKEACASLPSFITAAAFRAECAKSGGFAASDSACSFWRDYNSKARELGCKHVASVAWALQQSGTTASTLSQICDAPIPTAAPEAPSDDQLVEVFARVCPADAKGRRKFPVLIQGTHGAGKTHGARHHGDTGGFDAVVECHGHAGIESIDFLGGMLPVEGDKTLVWVDGPVTEAFRRAAVGQRVLLIVDEIYRVPRRERSLFLSALSPALRKDGQLVYRLKTGRPISATAAGLMPTMEMVEAPESHISIIATTNVGAGYDVEDDDPAEASRWHKIHYTPGDAKTLAILIAECATLKLPDSLPAKLVEAVKNLRKLRTDGEVRLLPSTRELVRAAHLSNTAAEAKAALLEMSHAWVGLDTAGEPNPAQIKAVRAAITAAFR
jgi:MoxR-like ATPase